MAEVLGDTHTSVPDFNPEAYHQTTDLAELWLPRLGGYDYKVKEELPADEGAILSPKHTGMMDIPLLGVTTRHTYDRYARFVGKRELFEAPIVGSAVGNFFYERGGIRLDRKVRLKNQTAQTQIDQAIEDDELVVLFGEGTRTRSRKMERGRKVGKIRKGLAAQAMKHNVPIQTVGIAGTRHWYGRKYVVYGNVVHPDPDQYDLEDERSVVRYAKVITKQVHQGMQEATDEAYRERSKMRIFIPVLPKR
jgi:1-acyl-sn-glycerol-3-phosphate acyltransferase